MLVYLWLSTVESRNFKTLLSSARRGVNARRKHGDEAEARESIWALVPPLNFGHILDVKGSAHFHSCCTSP